MFTCEQMVNSEIDFQGIYEGERVMRDESKDIQFIELLARSLDGCVSPS